MKNAEDLRSLLHAMNGFSTYYAILKSEIEKYEQTTGKSVNDLPGFTESYPFDKSFDELEVAQWVTTTVESVRKSTFKVLNYEYLNTGGGCMVGIFEVWLPELKQVVYALTNEEGCTLARVDYIRNDLEIEDYDELMIENVDWGRITGHEQYFELYRYCLNEYVKSDSKRFGYSKELPYFLLSDELQKQCTPKYLQWLADNGYDGVETDGEKIKLNVYYELENDYDDALQRTEERLLKNLRDFQQWHASIGADEEYYNDDYTLTFAGRTIQMPFVADVWDAIDTMLESVIKNY